jgi:hypothetical protein
MIFSAGAALKTKISAAVDIIQKHIRNKVNETAETVRRTEKKQRREKGLTSL